MYVFSIYQSFFNSDEYFIGTPAGTVVFAGTLSECQDMAKFINSAQYEIAQTYC